MEVKDAPFTPYHGTRKRDIANKLFIAWDGEGITPPGEKRQNYVLLGNSQGIVLQAPSGGRLTTHKCLQAIIDTELLYPDALHVGFAFSYDVEMMLFDLPLKTLRVLRQYGRCYYRGYRLEYKRSKWFSVGKEINGKKVFAKIWDVWGFFQSSFVQALKDNIGDIPELATIEAGKSGRAQFTYDELESGYMLEYMNLELKHTVTMMNTLRQRLYDADLKINHWHGPGAIASHAMGKRKVDRLLDREIPKPVNDAAQYAYAGGRFELFRAGHHNGPVYAYDIRSAYPSAMVDLPDLNDGVWTLNRNPDPQQLARFGVYRIRFRSPALMSQRPMPFFYRDAKHRIHFPNVCEGWYWTPEAKLAAIVGNDAEIIEGWEFSETDRRPMQWVNDVYETRAQWKRDGNPSQQALKLLINSMYGKFAQRIGWEIAGKAPKWHQLEWAGYITSHARAKLFRAMLLAQKHNALLGVETDGIFSTVPLALDLGPGLGQWEATEYESMIYLQSGFYFKKEAGQWSAKYRGFDKGCITPDSALETLANWRPWEGTPGILAGTTTRFTTMGYYLNTKEPNENRNRWISSPRILSIGGDGKRVHRHTFCTSCREETSPAEATHGLTISQPIGAMSHPHSLPWLTSAPNPYHSLEEDGISHDH